LFHGIVIRNGARTQWRNGINVPRSSLLGIWPQRPSHIRRQSHEEFSCHSCRAGRRDSPASAQSFCTCDGTGNVLPFTHKAPSR
jgi:hypothetical protein